MRPNRGQLEGAGAPKRTCPVLCPGRRAQEGVGKVSLSVSLSLNRPFLPLLQMSESETLISMVNRMVESSSPRAQLFMQVRPLLAAWALSTPCQLLVHGPVNPPGDGARSAQPTHLPGLISQAQPGLPPLMPLCSLHSSCSWINPSPISQTIKIAPTSHACQGPRICFLMPRASILYLVSSPQTLLGMRAWVCDREPFKANGVERVLWLLDASWRAGSMYWTQRHFCMCINPG